MQLIICMLYIHWQPRPFAYQFHRFRYYMSKRKHFWISSKGFHDKRDEDTDMHTVRLGIENNGCPL